MKNVLKSIYFFLPIQLLLLHFRKYLLLLIFWIILYLTFSGNLAPHFGASSLLLAPEYLGALSFTSMFLLGGALCVFIMMWHITTFIIHSKRMPYMGATRQAFIVYCINNSIIPIVFLIIYSITSVRFLRHDENSSISHILLLQLGFYLGLALVTFLTFIYFFSVSRNLFKLVLSKITNPARIRNIIPYDSLDYEIDILQSESYISLNLKIEKSTDLETYHPRVMNTVLRRHHRNVIFGTFICYLILLLAGFFIEKPLLRIPAGCGFLLMFSIIMGFVAAVKYFLKSWEAIGWVIIILVLSLLVENKVFDFRSIAYGLNYTQTDNEKPEYSYNNLHEIFNPNKYNEDKNTEEKRLQNWKNKYWDSNLSKPPLVVITVTGGGSRSAFWTFRTLQYIDSISNGNLFKNTVMITGASGGMIGATYWRNLKDAYLQGKIKDIYKPAYQENIGKDLLNAIIISLASIDMVSPINRIKLGKYNYVRDRGYAMEQEMINNTDGILDNNLDFYKNREEKGEIPQIIFASTVVNDGRKLIISGQPLSYLTQPEYSLYKKYPPIDCIDFATFFKNQNPYNLRIATALRMNATFPYVLPVVKLPSVPNINVMDAGLRDNFGTEVANRYLFVLRNWLEKNVRDVIFLEIRDTRENGVCTSADETTLNDMITDPLFVIQNKWEAFQSYNNSMIKDFSPSFLNGKLHYFTIQYMPKDKKKVASLNFHLTQKEKNDIYQSIYNQDNQETIKSCLQLLQ